MARIGICGHFAGDSLSYNGQTVKTRIVTEELKKKYGDEALLTVDTFGGAGQILRHIAGVIRLELKCRNVMILPAQNGIRVFAPLLAFLNIFFKRRLHYIVIGGWLPEFVASKRFLLGCLKHFDHIYVETDSMKESLEALGLNNVSRLVNFKRLDILKESELVYAIDEPYSLCTFSRVMKEKGIGIALEAVRNINTRLGRTAFKLDIYGQIEASQEEWFRELMEEAPEYVQYKGIVPYSESIEVIKSYYALLFPTYYDGEGFAGTLIDAMAAGVPVIASNWKYNAEIIRDLETGLIINESESLEDKLMWIYEHRDIWNSYKQNILKDAFRYLPEEAMKPLYQRIV